MTLLLTLASGCAMLTASKTDVLEVESNPPGAQVVVNGRVAGQTPTTVELERAARHPARVELQLPGYRPATCRTRMQAGIGYVVADAVICFFSLPVLYLGCLAFLDANGAWNELDTPLCSVTMQPESVFPPVAGPPADVVGPPPEPGLDGSDLPPPPPPPQL